MKAIIIILSLLVSQLALAQDRYEAYLQSIQRELSRTGMQVGANGQNPFITGTALQNYFLNERVLLLERDAFFMMRANKLSTTEEIADYQHRLKVLTSHGNNILLQMVRALANAKEEGFVSIEAPKHQVEMEKLIEDCRKDPACVSRRLASGEVVVQSDIFDSFALSTQLFGQIPYMHAIEFASLFQLVQLIYMESIMGHAKIGRVEFDVFLKKQKALVKEIDGNRQLTAREREFHRTMVNNTVNRWKRTIAERKFDQKERFAGLAERIKLENQSLIRELERQRAQTPEILPEEEACRRFMRVVKDRRRCELRAKVEQNIGLIKRDTAKFIGKPEKKLPREFFESI
jgi:hypothetical protein